MAFALAIIGVAVGIVLGLRYKVLVLVPAVMFAMILTILAGVARADSFWSIVLTAAALVTAVQLGYLVGIVIRAVIGAIWPPRKGGHNSDSDGKSDTQIAYAWQHFWQLDGWAEWGSIVSLHPLRPPQA
jgi:hypothetical protein